MPTKPPPYRTGTDFSATVKSPSAAPASVKPSGDGRISDKGLAFDQTGRAPEPTLTDDQRKYLEELDRRRSSRRVHCSGAARAELECILKGSLSAFHVSSMAERNLFRTLAAPFNIRLPKD
jgi:hypothetical protein